jgi:hypothetical protein
MKSVILVFLVSVFLLNFISAGACDLSPSLLNQDPYPAVPGDYVKLVFQVDGLENPECSEVSFELLENYPISFDPNSTREVLLKSGTFIRDYSSSLVIPYKVRIDQNALDGDTPIEVIYSNTGGANTFALSKKFNLSIEEVKATFEISVKNFDSLTNILTLEVLNIGKSDVEALSIEIPKQDNIEVKGANKKIIGALDSKDFTTADFEAVPRDGNIDLIISYNDKINIRRTINQSVVFDSSYFQNRMGQQKSSSKTWIVVIIVLLVVGYFWYRRKQDGKKKKLFEHMNK